MPERTAEQRTQKRSTLRTVLTAAAVLCGVLMLCGFGYLCYLGWSTYTLTHAAADYRNSTPETTTETTTTTTTTVTLYPLAASRTTETVTLGDDLVYGNTAALIAVHEDGNILLAEKNADAVIFPASMTKIMTMLTYFKLCGEDGLDTAVVMDSEVLSFAWQNSASCAGFYENEVCTVRDLLYGTMLPSGADAALMLAKLASGGEAAFVREMNAYAEEMGLANTHFVNCTGLHDEAHYSTAQDIAVMLGYAIQDPLCCELMSAAVYVTEPNDHHTKGLTMKSTLFNRMTGEELPARYGIAVTVRGGKTGYTDEAGQCLATWAEDTWGNVYLAVVAGCKPKEPYEAIDDTLTLYMMTQLPYAAMTRYTAEPDETTTETTTTTAAAETTALTLTTTAAVPPVSTAPAVTQTAPPQTAAATVTTVTTTRTTVTTTATTAASAAPDSTETPSSEE